MIDKLKEFLVNPANSKLIIPIISIIIIISIFFWLIKKTVKGLVIGIIIAFIISTLAQNGILMNSLDGLPDKGVSTIIDLQKKYDAFMEKKNSEESAK